MNLTILESASLLIFFFLCFGIGIFYLALKG